MIRPRAALLACLLALPASAQKAKPLVPYPLKKHVLKNGLTLVRVPFHSPGLVAYYTVVRVGSRNEVEEGHTGFAHFFEHMMFKGTPSWPEGGREALLGKLGFDENAFTSDDVTVYHVSGPSSGLEKLVELEADRFRNLQYGEATFQTEAKAVLGEYHKNAASPFLKIEEELSSTAFTRHTYRHTTLGFYEDIKKMPGYYEYSKEFFRRWYTPDNTLVFVVGDFDDQKLLEWAEKHYGGWTGKAAKVDIPKEPPQTAGRSVHIDWNTPTLPRHIYAWHAPATSPSTPDGAIQNVLASYLSGPTSPLHKDLVLTRHLCESVGSSFSDHRDPSLFTLTATLKEEKHRPEVAAAFDAQVKALASGKVDSKRVQDTKDHLRYALLMGLETPDQVALQLGYHAGVLGTPDGLELLYQAISRVRPEQLVQFARKHLAEKNRTVLALTHKPPQPQSEGGRP
ncbi:MAG: insulinase family protein [Myxococcales bacterium]|nr:insulinase family protein [Myxococcales bacterium]